MADQLGAAALSGAGALTAAGLNPKTYYISQQVGNDSNDGLSPAAAHAWLTLAKANTDNLLFPGDKVYVGPGAYRQAATLVLNESGSAGNPIKWIGDPDCLHMTSDNPGIVRVTGAAVTTEIKQLTNGVINVESVDYVEFEGFLLDGNDGAYKMVRNNVAKDTTIIFRDCVAYGRNLWQNVRCERCIGIGNLQFTFCDCYECVSIGGQYTYTDCNSYGCASFGAVYAFYMLGSKVSYNCLAYGAQYGFYSSAADHSDLVSHCHLFAVATLGQYCTTHAVTYSCCGTAWNGRAGDAPTESGVTLLDKVDQLKRALEPGLSVVSLLGTGDASLSPSTVDILMRPRPMGVSDIGPWELADRTLDYAVYQTAPPSIKISGAGQQILQIPAKAGVAITVTVQAKHDSASTKPQIILKGQSIAEQADTVTAGNDTWEELQVTETPDIDETLELVLYGREAGKVAYFSDIAVT